MNEEIKDKLDACELIDSPLDQLAKGPAQPAPGPNAIRNACKRHRKKGIKLDLRWSFYPERRPTPLAHRKEEDQ